MLSEPERELVYDTLAKDQDERMALALQKAEYNGQQEDECVPFTGVSGPVDFDLDLQIAKELQMKDWQEEEKKKKAPEEEEAGKGEGEEVVEIEGVDMDALRKFIAKEVEGFFAQKLSEVMKSAQPAVQDEEQKSAAAEQPIEVSSFAEEADEPASAGIRCKGTITSSIDLTVLDANNEHDLKGSVNHAVTQAFSQAAASTSAAITQAFAKAAKQ